MTIVGFERHKDGTCNLLVFDPAFKPSKTLCQMVGKRVRCNGPARLLKAHRRGVSCLSKHQVFEILQYDRPLWE